MAGKSAGKSERSDRFFPCQDFAMANVTLNMVVTRVISAFESRQIQCHIYLTSYLLTYFPEFIQGNIGSRLLSFKAWCAQFVLPRPRVNIPRYGPRAWLLRGY